MTGALVEGGQIRIFHLEDDLTALARWRSWVLAKPLNSFAGLSMLLPGAEIYSWTTSFPATGPLFVIVQLML